MFNQLVDTRNELRGIFGIQGSTPQGIEGDKTVRGKIITRGQDTSRIGGGIAEYLEQFYDQIYNWMVQMMYVYYDEDHSASVLGNEGAREMITIRNTDLNRKLTVSVKEGSLIPTDALTKRNEAVDLWSAGALDPITLFERLEFPNPREAAEKLIKFRLDPQSLFSDTTGQPIQQPAQPGAVQPGETQQPISPGLAGTLPPPEVPLSEVPLEGQPRI